MGAGKAISTAGKGVAVGTKEAIKAGGKKAIAEVSDKLKEAISRGWDGRLAEYQFNPTDGTFTGKGGGKLINTGQKDPITGEYIFQRINSQGKPYDSYLVIDLEGKQHQGMPKPKAFKSPQVTGNIENGYSRPYLRKNTLEKIFEGYAKLENGDYEDAFGNIVKRPIDIGHAYGWEHRRLSLAAKELKMTQKEFNDYVNTRPEKFRLENRLENSSHKNELPGNDIRKELLDDMNDFLKKYRKQGENYE